MKRKPLHYHLSSLQIESLAHLLQQEERTASPHQIEERPAIDPPGECLTQEQFLAYSLQTLQGANASEWAQHLQFCPACAAEFARLQQFMHVWENEHVVSSLETRIGRTLPPLPTAKRPLFVSLKLLLRPQGAFGEDTLDESATVEFPVADAMGNTTGLQGTLYRQRRDFYLQIRTLPPETAPSYVDRLVQITVTDPKMDTPLLQRRLEIGVTIMLGTDLKITEECVLSATLLAETQPYGS